MLELLRIQIEPTPIIHPLPQQLDGGLGSIPLLTRHIQIIDEDHDMGLTFLGTVVPLPSSSAHLTLYDLLDLVDGSLTRKYRLQVGILLIKVIQVELADDVDGLTSTRLAAQQQVDPIRDAKVNKIIVAYRIVRRNHQFMVRKIPWYDVLTLRISPLYPTILFDHVHQIEKAFLIKLLPLDGEMVHIVTRFNVVLLRDIVGAMSQLLHEFVECFSRCFLERRTDGPYGRV